MLKSIYLTVAASTLVFGLAPLPVAAQGTCAALKELVIERDFALSPHVSSIAAEIDSASGNAAATKKVCDEARAFYKAAADLKTLIHQKKSLCTGEKPPEAKIADVSLLAVSEMTKEICK
jgi:hypothetical protein